MSIHSDYRQAAEQVFWKEHFPKIIRQSQKNNQKNSDKSPKLDSNSLKNPSNPRGD